MTWFNRHPAAVWVALVLGFLVGRGALFALTTAGEYRLYRDYGDAARKGSLSDLFRHRDVEYPHLAVLFGSLAGSVADCLPTDSAQLVRLRPNKGYKPYLSETEDERAAGDRYEVGLGLVLFAVDMVGLVLVGLIARQMAPSEGQLARIGRLVVYTVATGAIGLILYDRQDLVVGVCALLAVWALITGRPVVGYAILTLGTGFKLVPVLLLPVWVLAAAAVRAQPGATPGRFLGCVVREAVIAGLILATWPVLTYAFGGGERGFVFLTYHSARGLQLEAPAAVPVLLLGPVPEADHGYGSFNLRGDLADRVARFATFLMPLGVLVAVAISARGFWRYAHQGARLPSARSYPALVPHVVASSLLVWLGFILTNKVGSPQYMLWVAPLVPLLPLRSWAERGWAGLLLVVMLLTTAIFPCAYSEILGGLIQDDPRVFGGPTSAGMFLLAAKSETLLVLVVWLAVSVWRAPHIPAPNPVPGPPRVPEPHL